MKLKSISGAVLRLNKHREWMREASKEYFIIYSRVYLFISGCVCVLVLLRAQREYEECPLSRSASIKAESSSSKKGLGRCMFIQLASSCWPLFSLPMYTDREKTESVSWLRRSRRRRRRGRRGRESLSLSVCVCSHRLTRSTASAAS